MKKIIYSVIVATLSTITLVAQAGERLVLYRNGQPTYAFRADDVDSIAFDNEAFTLYSADDHKLHTGVRSDVDSLVFEPIPTSVEYVMPPLNFGEVITPAQLQSWADANAAMLVSRLADELIYEVNSPNISRVTLLLDDNQIYREAVLTTTSSSVVGDTAYTKQYLGACGVTRVDANHAFGLNPQYFLVDMYAQKNSEDIHIYGTRTEVNLNLPFTRLGEKLTADSVRTLMTAAGYRYIGAMSTDYLLRFDTGDSDFPYFYVGINETTKRTEGVAVYAANKYIYRSIGLINNLLAQGFVETNTSRWLTPQFYRQSDYMLAEVVYDANPNLEKPGYVRFMLYGKPMTIDFDSIDVPVPALGKMNEQQVIAAENARGRKTTKFFNTLNALTGNPYFQVHGYDFDSNTGLCKVITTVLESNNVIDSPDLERCLKLLGFEFQRENVEAGTKSYTREVFEDGEQWIYTCLVQRATANGQATITWRRI